MFDMIYRFDPATADLYKAPADADEALQVLVQGNRDFAEMTDARRNGAATRIIPFDPRAFGWGVAEGTAPLQTPFAAVLGCSDARLPTEMVFSKGCNELFVVRVAGNVLGSECLGSLHYAVHHFPSTLKLIVILAHERCGAVTEAVDVYLEPKRYIQLATIHPLRGIADQLLVSVRASAIALEVVYGPDITRNPGYRAAIIEAAVVINAAWSAYCLQEEFRNRSQQDLHVVFGMYDLVSRYVRLPLSPPNALTDGEKGLFAAPKSVECFRELALQICSGKLVQSYLGVATHA